VLRALLVTRTAEICVKVQPVTVLRLLKETTVALQTIVRREKGAEEATSWERRKSVVLYHCRGRIGRQWFSISDHLSPVLSDMSEDFVSSKLGTKEL